MLSFLVVSLVFAAWIMLYVMVIRPKLDSFRLTAGIYAKIDAAESTLWTRIALRLKGAKVAIVGVLTSSLPVLIPAIAQIYGLNWAQFFPPDKAEICGLLFALAGIIGPMIMTMLHSYALDDAAKIEPSKE